MQRPRSVRTLACLILLAAAAAPVRADALLRPSAARRVEENTAAITAELRDVIASTRTSQGEQLQGLVDGDSSNWGIRYRDGHLLFSIPVRKNLSLREKNDGEKEARKLVLVILGQKFNQLLELADASQGLDPKAIEVILIEPDAMRAYSGFAAGGSGGYGGQAGIGGLGWQTGSCMTAVTCPCLPAPPPCGCE